MKMFSVPIRLKLLITVMAILMLVVGVITSTMANLFHQDKIAYVRDYNAAVTEEIRAGTYSVLRGYTSATQILSEILLADHVSAESKQIFIEPLFAAYPELLVLAITTRSSTRSIRC